MSIGVAAIYYTLTLRNSQKAQQLQLETRQAQLYMQVFSMSFNNKTFLESYNRVLRVEWKDYDDFVEIIGWNTETTEIGHDFSLVLSFYEGLGVMVKEKMLDIHVIALMMSGMTRMLWEKIEPIKDEHREAIKLPRWMSEFEYLCNELFKYHEERPELKT